MKNQSKSYNNQYEYEDVYLENLDSKEYFSIRLNIIIHGKRLLLQNLVICLVKIESLKN